ncbi:hypothetical protein [Micromonospora sp. NPDC023956]|uniref:hypothetical protein n=1 Tax=Micromonospora sp. NPDC023956 TaxID=3155722 RepID=UPI0033C203D6
MAKTDYWMADGYGNKALVEGAAERDRWKPLGWAETTEPEPGDMVWMEHPETGGRQRFAAAVIEQWQGLGWHPAAPPEPVDVLHDSQLVDQAAPVASAVVPKSTDRTAASGTTPKES